MEKKEELIRKIRSTGGTRERYLVLYPRRFGCFLLLATIATAAASYGLSKEENSRIAFNDWDGFAALVSVRQVVELAAFGPVAGTGSLMLKLFGDLVGGAWSLSERTSLEASKRQE